MSSDNIEIKPPDGDGYTDNYETPLSSTATLQFQLDTDLPPISSSHIQGVPENGEIPIKVVGPNNVEIVPEDFVTAPDGRWGWVVVFVAFTCNMIVDGTVFSFGIIVEPMARSGLLTFGVSAESSAEDLDTMKMRVAWVGAMLAGFYLATGPIVSPIVHIIGYRLTAVAGCCIAFIGFIIGWFLNMNNKFVGSDLNLPALYTFVGFFGGVGLCLLSVSSMIAVGYYFDKKRALATGIALCGSGVGIFLYPPSIVTLLIKFGWPMTLLVESFWILCCTFLVAFYCPLQRTRGGTRRPITLLVKPSEIIDIGNGEYRIFHAASPRILNKPLNQPNIFYTGSVRHLKWDIGLEAVPENLIESKVVFANSSNQGCRFGRFTIPVLRNALDFSLFKSLSFVILATSGLMAYLGLFVPYAYISELAQQNSFGLAPRTSASLVSVIGFSTVIGRGTCIFVPSGAKKHLLFIHNVALTVAGLTTAIAPFIVDFRIFAFYAYVYGVSITCFVSLRSILVVQLMGITKLTSAFGLLCVFHGMGALLGIPLAQYWKEVTRSYDLSFHAAGVFIVLSALMCYPLNIINNCEKKRVRKEEFIIVQLF